MGILGRDVMSLGPLEFRNSPGIMGKDVISLGPLEILEFLELWEFWEEISYHWALWNSGNPVIMGNMGRDN